MGIRRGLTVFFIVSLSVIYCLFGCGENDPKTEGANKYSLVDYHYSDNCNIYKMIFSEEKCVFRVALSGSCNELTADEYVKNVDAFLNSYSDSLSFSSDNYLRLEYYSSTGIDKEHIDQIITLLKIRLDKEFILSESWEEGAELKVRKDNSSTVSI